MILQSKIGWRNIKTCWFGSAKLYSLQWLVKGAATLSTSRKECNKQDLTAAQCFSLVHHNDCSRWFAISSPTPICRTSFSSMGGLAKQTYNWSWMWKKLLQGHILTTTGDALAVSNLSHLVFWTVKLLNKQAGSFDQILKPSKIPFSFSQGDSSVQCEFSVSENDWIILLDDDDDYDDDVRLWVLDNKDTKIAALFSV